MFKRVLKYFAVCVLILPLVCYAGYFVYIKILFNDRELQGAEASAYLRNDFGVGGFNDAYVYYSCHGSSCYKTSLYRFKTDKDLIARLIAKYDLIPDKKTLPALEISWWHPENLHDPKIFFSRFLHRNRSYHLVHDDLTTYIAEQDYENH